MTEKEQVWMSIPANVEYISTVRLTTSSIANKIGFDVEEIEDIVLSVSEALNNYMDNKGQIDIRFTIDVHGMEMEVLSEMEDVLDEEELHLREMILGALMDEVHITAERIHLIKRKG